MRPAPATPSSQRIRFACGPAFAASRISSLLKNPAKPGNTGDRERADEHRPVGDRNLLAQAAHLHHVLLAAHGVDHAAGGEEEQALEEGVRHQVEDARGVGAHAAGQEHVAELRHGRVRENFLDVGLHQADGGGIERGDRADDGDDQHGDRRAREKRIHARDHVHARGDHRRGVNQRADGRGAFHRVGQPDVKRQLRGFSDRAGEKQQANRGEHALGHRTYRDTFAKISPNATEPNVANTSRMPTVKPKSPMRVTMKAFLPASAADFFRNQKPISK